MAAAAAQKIASASEEPSENAEVAEDTRGGDELEEGTDVADSTCAAEYRESEVEFVLRYQGNLMTSDAHIIIKLLMQTKL